MSILVNPRFQDAVWMNIKWLFFCILCIFEKLSSSYVFVVIMQVISILSLWIRYKLVFMANKEWCWIKNCIFVYGLAMRKWNCIQLLVLKQKVECCFIAGIPSDLFCKIYILLENPLCYHIHWTEQMWTFPFYSIKIIGQFSEF